MADVHNQQAGANQNRAPQRDTHKVIKFLPGEKLISFPEVQRIIPVSKTRWYELMQLGEAPRPIKISRQKVAWLESEILDFVNNRIAERNEKFNIKR